MVFIKLIALSRQTIISILLTTIVILLADCSTFAQRKRTETPPLKERLFYGGSVGFQFGTVTDIELSPIIGLWVRPRLAVAAGPNYRFYKDPNNRTEIYGGRFYTEFVVIRDIGSIIPLGSNLGIFLHAEDEWLSLESSFWKNPPFTSNRFNINTVLAGAGISQQLGRRSSMNFMVLWALNDSFYDIYSNPEFRISIIF